MADSPNAKFSDTFWILIIIFYFAFHVLYRTALGGALGLDEAEIILDAQSFRLGYGPQLPLYAWLQRLVFLVTGPTIFGLSLLKNVLLCGMVLTLYFVLRTTFPARIAALGAASLILVPQFSWESQRALTHSVLMSFSAMFCFATLWLLARRASGSNFTLLGAVLAVGGLTKYNFAIMPVAVLLSCLCFPQMRANLFRWGLAGSFLLCAVLLAVPFVWVLQNPEIAFDSAHKFEMVDQIDVQTFSFAGVIAVLKATFNFLLLPALVLGALLIFSRDRTVMPPPATDLERLMHWTIGVALVLLLIGTTVAGVTNMKDRWLQPALLLAVPAATLWLLPRLTVTGNRRLQQIYISFMILITLALPVHFFKPGANVAARFDRLMPQVTATMSSDAVLIADQWVAGNLFYYAKDRRVVKIGGRDNMPEMGDLVLVWVGSDLVQGQNLLLEALPKDKIAYLETPKVFQAPYRFSGEEEFFTLSVARVVRD